MHLSTNPSFNSLLEMEIGIGGEFGCIYRFEPIIEHSIELGSFFGKRVRKVFRFTGIGG